MQMILYDSSNRFRYYYAGYVLNAIYRVIDLSSDSLTFVQKRDKQVKHVGH